MTIPAIVSLATGAARGVLANRERAREDIDVLARRARQKAADEVAEQEREDREAGNRGAFDTLHRHDPDGYPAFMRGFDYQGLAREMLQERRRRLAEEEAAAEARKVYPGIPANLAAAEVLRAARTMAAAARRPQPATTVARSIRETATAQDAAVYVGRHPELAGLSDAEIVRRGRGLETRRPAAARGTRGASGTVLQRLSQARSRLVDVRRDITDAERATGEGRSRYAQAMAEAHRTPVEQARFAADSTRATRRLPGLRALRDSLSAVRDSLASIAPGGRAAGAQPTAGAGVLERATRAAAVATERLDVTQDEFDELVGIYGQARARRYYRVVPAAGSRAPGASAATKTPAEWVAEVRADPAIRGATREDVIAEARRRAGVPAPAVPPEQDTTLWVNRGPRGTAGGVGASAPSEAQRDWDALPGTTAQKIARVGPRPLR